VGLRSHRRGRAGRPLCQVAEARRDDRARLGHELLGHDGLGNGQQRGNRGGVLQGR
jgi:hypothetical protein